MTKDDIKDLQRNLGVTPDGIFGPQSIRALQKRVGTTPDGILGPKTKAAAKAAGISIPGQELALNSTWAQGPSAVAPAASPPAEAPQKTTTTKAAAVAAGSKAAAVQTALTAPAKPAAAALIPKAASNAPIQAATLAGKVPTAAVIQDAIAALPMEARAVAAQQLQTFASLPGGTSDDYNALIAGLSQSVAPQLQAISDAVAAKVVTTEATSESNARLAREESEARTAEMQAKILGAIQDLAVKVTAKDKLAQRYFKAYGIPT